MSVWTADNAIFEIDICDSIAHRRRHHFAARATEFVAQMIDSPHA
jgi:hypothetical protein